MQQENKNEFKGWRQRLDELSSLPGERLPDHDALWERLQARLSATPVPVHRKKYWHWVAAACVLIALLTLIRFSNKHRQHVEVTGNQPAQKTILPAKKEEDIKTVPKKNKAVVVIQKKPMNLKPQAGHENVPSPVNNEPAPAELIVDKAPGTQPAIQRASTPLLSNNTKRTKQLYFMWRLPIVQVNEAEGSKAFMPEISADNTNLKTNIYKSIIQQSPPVDEPPALHSSPKN